MTGFPDSALLSLQAFYPEQPAPLSHDLVGLPLLAPEALKALAQSMRPGTALSLRGDVPIGVGQQDVARTGLDPAATLDSIERGRSWMVLRNIEQDPAYRALLDRLVDAIGPAVRPATGPILKREGFIFVSSPNAVTPLHFDPEHNILMQLEGRKTITLFPVADEAIAPLAAHETFEREGRNNLAWNAGFERMGRTFALEPGDALYIPVKTPHWVQNGDAASVSLSITWRSGWSLREGYAHGMNRLLRKAGLSPRAPRRFPRDNHLKALSYRAILKARRCFGQPG
jgi:hypothetical protein